MASIERLYDFFEPEHYDLFLDVSREDKRIKGKTIVKGRAKQTAMALHQHDLAVESVKVNGQSVDFNVDKANDQIRFDVKEAGEQTIEVSYQAPLTDNMNGIYPSYYSVDGKAKQVVSTQFETYFARQAFPSIDEPEAKATFSLALKFDEKPGEVAIANMPETRVEDGVHYFEKTVKMSTYLVAFAFGDFQSIETTTKSGIKVGVYATKAHPAKDMDFALDIAKRSIDFYEGFYQTPYPLAQSLQVALPDFSAGAMENWGMVTYREAYLLVDPDNTELSMKQTVATVIAHELAHQWFGDLVTMKWWDELWLNESFANMMEFVAIDAIEPDWHIWETFNANDAQAALRRDALPGVQPVHVAVHHPEEIDALFDPAIVYAKGAHLLVMLRSLIGDDALRQGLKAYFDKKAYGNATGDDLWAALGAASGQDIGAIMKTWLDQPGYPVLSVTIEDGRVKVSQTPFVLGDKQADDKRLWQVPLAASAPGLPKLLTKESADLGDWEAIKAASKGPFRLNVGNAGHYIVSYDDEILAEQVKALTTLSAIDQAQFVQNALLLAQNNQVSYADLLPIMPLLADSKSALVQNFLYQAIAAIKVFAEPDSKTEAYLQVFTRGLSTKRFEALGLAKKADDSVSDELARPVVVGAALFGKNPELLAEAHQVFAKAGSAQKLPADGRTEILKNELVNFNNQESFAGLLADYQETANASLKRDLSSALAATPNSLQIQTLIASFQDPEVIKPQDLRNWFAGVLANPVGQDAAWAWFQENWDWLVDRLGGDMSFSSYITVIARIFKTREKLDEFNAFFEDKKNQPGIAREIVVDAQMIENRVKLVEEQEAAVAKALNGLVK
ncbi:M1 family metallopeptidase [Fructobacillus sp. M1-13]|uniref:Aminopeptidase n=1 Tax=Fructobacillus papyriferae TaxID=2713171 RepID=A0ABS5QPH5_9LACO|nr:M1 family metallopeptidase [Fructobacillus papyriferae]MBS9335079.1 M1 family metallopeptidase [Fructobacillus papyriferae]MCD2159435.1 M1 family metallopeptidase [Fructobacillus papyriferae]